MECNQTAVRETLFLFVAQHYTFHMIMNKCRYHRTKHAFHGTERGLAFSEALKANFSFAVYGDPRSWQSAICTSFNAPDLWKPSSGDTSMNEILRLRWNLLSTYIVCLLWLGHLWRPDIERLCATQAVINWYCTNYQYSHQQNMIV